MKGKKTSARKYFGYDGVAENGLYFQDRAISMERAANSSMRKGTISLQHAIQDQETYLILGAQHQK